MQYIVGLLFLCLLITLHEFGHFIAARLAGVYVEEFAIGMGPCIYSKVSKKSGTQYSLRLVPIGGYCAMKGETVTLDEEGKQVMEEADSFPNVSVWKRMGIVLAGPIMNIFIGVLIAMTIVMCFGISKPYITSIEDSVRHFGLQEGDRLVAINDTPMHVADDVYFYDMYHADDTIDEKRLVKVTVERDGQQMDIEYPLLYQKKYGFGMSTGTDKDGNLMVLQILKENALAKAGIEEGDKIVSINGIKGTSDYSLHEYLADHPLTDGTADVVYERDGKAKEATVQLIPLESTSRGFAYNTKAQTSNHVLQDSMAMIQSQISTTFQSLGGLVTGRFSLSDLSGPVAIVDVIGDTYESAVTNTDTITKQANVQSLMGLLLMVTLSLGVFNLLPIPGLDGGTFVFLVIEAIRRKRIPVEIEQKIRQVSLCILLGLSVFIIIKDFYQILF